MKKSILVLFAFLFVKLVSAQNVGINTTGSPPDVSAMLDVVSASKGLLIPRVALTSSTDAASIATPATSLLVYNTGLGGLSPAGYYYNSGTTLSPVWVQLLNGGSPGTAWLLSGNSGTTAGTNFLGTTDAKDVVIKANNTEGIRLYSGGIVTSFGTGTAVAPSSSSGLTSLVLKGSTSNFNINLQDGGGRTSLLWNATGTGGTYLVSSEVAARMTIVPSSTYGAFAFYGAPTGTAGSAITWTQSGYIGYGDAVWFSPRGTSSDLYIPNATGNVGVGTTSPGYKFTIAGTGSIFGVDNTAVFVAKNSAAAYEQYFWPRWSDNIMYMNYGSAGFNIRNNSSVSTMFMSNTGDVGIGLTPSGSYKLEVNGRLKTTGINETSDLRYKKDISTIENALSKVKELRGVTYSWRTGEFKENNFSSSPQIGLIAQEVEKIFPQLVGTDADGFKSVEYSKLVAVLIEAIKEQQKIIDSQQKDISSLKTSVDLLQKQNTSRASAK